MKLCDPLPAPSISSLRPSRRLAKLFALAALALAASAVGGQQPPPAEPPATEQAPPNQAPPSQAAPPLFTDIVQVRVVNVDVFVTDRSGVPVVGLGPEDFELEVDGRPMPISNFYAESGGRAREAAAVAEASADPSFMSVEEFEETATRRSYLVILVDHQRLSANNRKRAFAAVREALESLGREHLVAVVGVEGSLVFYSDFLHDRLAIEQILDDVLQIAPPSGLADAERRQVYGELARGMSGGIQARASLADEQLLISRIRAYAAEEYARSVGSLRQIELVVSTLAGVSGRKSVLYVGEGIPTRPGEGLFVEWRNRFGQGNPNAGIGMRRFDFNTDYTRAVGRFDLSAQIAGLAQAANRAGVTFYAVDAEGDHGGLLRSALTEQGATSEAVSVVEANYREPLESAAKVTGGRLLRSSGKLEEQLVNILGDFDSYYSLGFTQPPDWEPGSAHRIDVAVKGKNLLLRHRERLVVPAADEREASATVAALRYRTADNPLGIRAAAGEMLPRDDGAAVLQMRVEIPVGELELLPWEGRHAGSLSLYVSTKDREGNASRVQKIPFNLAIPDEVIDQARSELAHYDLPVIVRPGDQQVAIGVRDNVSGRFSAVRVDLAP